MKILVTGGAGFIGSSLCLRLKEKYPGYSILAFDNLKRRGSELNLRDLQKAGVDFVHGDIRNSEDLRSAGPFDVLVEASAEPSVMAGLDSDPTYVINNNLVGSINCFNACLEKKARVIFLSTSRIYPIDPIESAAFVEEEARFSFRKDQPLPGISPSGISEACTLEGSRSFYGATKLSSELFLAEYCAFYGLQAAVTRFSVVAGPRQMGKTDQGVAALWAARHFWEKPLSYIGYGGKGKQVRDLLHIDDLVDLVDLQVHRTEMFNGKVFNAGGGLANSLSLLEMTRLCEKLSGHSISIASVPENRPADLRIYITDNSKITAATGWAPQRSANKIFEDIFTWLAANEKTLKPIFA